MRDRGGDDGLAEWGDIEGSEDNGGVARKVKSKGWMAEAQLEA